jgi:DDE superfamily endonuclease
MEGLANAAGHADRHTPLKNYCKGLLLPGERKSVEPMAARLTAWSLVSGKVLCRSPQALWVEWDKGKTGSFDLKSFETEFRGRH